MVQNKRHCPTAFVAPLPKVKAPKIFYTKTGMRITGVGVRLNTIGH